ncbi:ER membrane protein complex subunit 5 [Candida viswanathii]|uniref:ER membrane protein complex subunit 5 n=1 Tax=Candida viswanathii TaxID=5486 RepID=A0A367YAI9_9ASCO|nr:ER membrane protein complex subunit 5 [Candida viswanathii]
MASTSKQYLLYLIGTLLLVHSGYSSFEFHKISIHHPNLNKLPLDIIIESLVGILLLVIGAIASIQNDSFLSLDNEVVSNDSKYLKFIEMKDAVQLGERVGVTDYEEFNSRLPFIDVVKKRKEYSEWLEKE